MDLEVRVIDSIKGKGLIALKSFNKGELIFEEKPICSSQFCWNRDYRYLACDHCMKSLETPVENLSRLLQNPNYILPYNNIYSVDRYACQQCRVDYCSLECRLEAWDGYHRLLCHDKKDTTHPIERLREAWKKYHYPPETCSIDLILRILSLIAQHKNPECASAVFLEFCHKTISEDATLISKLLSGQFEGRMENLRRLVTESINIQRMNEDGRISQFLTSDGFLTLFALVAINGQGIASSPFAKWVKYTETLELAKPEKDAIDRQIESIYESLDEIVGNFLDNEGSGLYYRQSKVNHSCEPNAEVTFPHDNFKLVLKAKDNIQRGEEICFSYIDECELKRSRHSRHKTLKGNYLFVCKCPKCEREVNDPDVTSEDESEEEEGEEEEGEEEEEPMSE